jgi:hypothetical protein
VQASPSIARAGTSQVDAESKTKHKDDMANARLVPSILHAYIPPLRGAINIDNVPRDIEYTLVTTCLLKGVPVVCVDQDKIATLKFSDFNLGDCKVYNTLSPYKYLSITKVKNSKIILQQWTMNLVQSTLLNIMKIPHLRCHQEVNACVKLLLASYHRRYLWLICHITVDPALINRITGLSMKGLDPHEYYPRMTADHALAQKIKEAYGDVEKGARGYKVASIRSGTVCLAC